MIQEIFVFPVLVFSTFKGFFIKHHMHTHHNKILLLAQKSSLWGNIALFFTLMFLYTSRLCSSYYMSSNESCLSFVLHNQIPHSTLNPEKELHFVLLHIFGSTCFVHDLTLLKNKLFVKSIKCIFPGYSHLQKCYQCFSPQLQGYLVSVDVTF